MPSEVLGNVTAAADEPESVFFEAERAAELADVRADGREEAALQAQQKAYSDHLGELQTVWDPLVDDGANHPDDAAAAVKTRPAAASSS